MSAHMVFANLVKGHREIAWAPGMTCWMEQCGLTEGPILSQKGVEHLDLPATAYDHELDPKICKAQSHSRPVFSWHLAIDPLTI